MKDFQNDVKHLQQTLFITATARYAAELKYDLNLSIAESGQNIWEQINIYPLKQWVNIVSRQIIDSMHSSLRIMSAQHGATLWWQLLNENRQATQHFLDLEGVSDDTYKAWCLAQTWGIPMDASQFANHDDWQWLLKFGEKYQRILDNRNLLDESQLPAFLVKSRPSWGKILSGIKSVQVIGFSNIPKQYRELLNQIASTGCEVIYRDSWFELESARQKQLAAFSDPHRELDYMAQWCAEKLRLSPEIKIAIVVPNLSERKNEIVRKLSEACSPEGAKAYTSPLNSIVHVSVGDPINSLPAITQLLDLLSCVGRYIPFESLSRVLRSSAFYSSFSERAQRYRVEKALRKFSKQKISRSMLLAITSTFCKSWHERFEAQFDTLNSSEKLSLNGFFETVASLACSFRWLDFPEQDSYTYQLSEAWFNQLTLFKSNESHSEFHTFNHWLKLFKQHIKSVTFQPQYIDQPIELLGMLETSASGFDQVWMLGMDDMQWPPTTQPNAYIPFPLQQTHHMPAVDKQREHEFNTEVFGRWLSQAPEVHASYAVNIDGDLQVSAAEVIKNWDKFDIKNVEPKPIAALEKVTEVEVLPTINEELQVARGGTDLITSFVSCPFKAFAKYRLGLRTWDEPEPGLTAADIGSQNHKALELIWQRIETQKKLKSLTDNDLDQLIEIVVSDVLAMPESAMLPNAFLSVEAHRLTTVLRRWLKYEQQVKRDEFKVVATEFPVEESIDGLLFNFKIDRIDETEQGEYVIIDYKLSRGPSSKQYLQAEPEEWQLPLYALTYSQPVDALSIAVVQNKAKPEFKGVRSEEVSFAKLSPVKNSESDNPWNRLQEQWRTSLHDIISSYKQGNINVQPKKPAKDCQYCDFGTICRIHEKQQGVLYDD